MRKITLLLLLAVTFANAQNKITQEQIKVKVDSILQEGNLLYKHEKAAWLSTDIASANKDIRNQIAKFLAYQEGDSIKVIILNKENKCIYDLSYFGDISTPAHKSITQRDLTPKEDKLLSIKNKIVSGIIDQKIEVESYKDFGLNLVLLPYGTDYKLYIITGANKSQIIPFGNDYLIIADENGIIKSWKKFHSRLIALSTVAPNGEAVISTTHSHLRSEPFISATDICTFKLYGGLCGQKEFEVYSPELGMYFKYKLAENEIEAINNQ